MGNNSRREAAAALKKQQAAEDRRKKILFGTVAGIAVLLIGGLIALGIYLNRPEELKVVQPEASTTDDYGLVVGDGSTQVDLYVDYQCPVCKSFEDANGDKIETWVDDGDITLNLHILNFLDTKLNKEFSSRAGNAAIYALQESGDPVEFLDYSKKIFDNQPPEGSGETLTNDQLVALGKDFEFGSAFEDGVRDETYAGWIAEGTDTTFDKGDVTGTPTVFIDGTKVQREQMNDFQTLVQKAIDGSE
ncbi:DsbA family protein [Salininema proteolyticum]|uniref:DsbA family protein n=1 Tax=Salininema proteolyticum TaxID=1607685 RepID=A0ABV8U012_9ACTN